MSSFNTFLQRRTKESKEALIDKSNKKKNKKKDRNSYSNNSSSTFHAFDFSSPSSTYDDDDDSDEDDNKDISIHQDNEKGKHEPLHYKKDYGIVRNISNVVQKLNEIKSKATEQEHHRQQRQQQHHHQQQPKQPNNNDSIMNRIQKAEIENVILKQILSSSNITGVGVQALLSSYITNSNLILNNSNDNDNGHKAIESRYTAEDILGDLTDYEDNISVHTSRSTRSNRSSSSRSVSRGRRSRSRGRSLSRSRTTTTSMFTPSSIKSTSTMEHSMTNDLFEDNRIIDGSGSDSRKYRSKSTGRIRLNGTTNESTNVVDDSLQLYDRFMKNLPCEKISSPELHKRKMMTSTKGVNVNINHSNHGRSTSCTANIDNNNEWDPFGHSFASKNVFDTTTKNSRSNMIKSRSQIEKPALKRFSSAPASNKVTNIASTHQKVAPKPLLERGVSTPHRFDPFSSTFNESFDDTSPLDKSNYRQSMTSSHTTTIYSFVDEEYSLPKKVSKSKMLREEFKLSPVKQKSETNESQASSNRMRFSRPSLSAGTERNVTPTAPMSNHNNMMSSWGSFAGKKNVTPPSKKSVARLPHSNHSNMSNSGFQIVSNASNKQLSHYSNGFFKKKTSGEDGYEYDDDDNNIFKESEMDKDGWGDFNETPIKADNPSWSADEFSDSFGCDVSKLTTSPISFKDSPIMHPSLKQSRKLNNSGSTLTTMSSSYKSSTKDSSQISGWSDIHSPDLVDFDFNSRKNLFPQERTLSM